MEFIVFTNEDVHYTSKSKFGLIGILKSIIDNNLYNLSKDPITIWDKDVFEKQSGIKILNK